MESLTETPWDVTISGTGLVQSLLALALSRSGKKVLHVDRNPYYGGAEAAFSLQEAEEWATQVNQNEHGPFEDATIHSEQASADGDAKLSFPRAYTLSLSSQLMYTRSSLLPVLVSSKVFRQLEFQAVGSWWIHRPSPDDDSNGIQTDTSLYRVPGSREDIFADELITMKSKKTLMRFLRHIGKDQDEESLSQEDKSAFSEYLASEFKVPEELHDPLLSLSLSQRPPQETRASYAVPRIKRHLASIGMLGPGFGSLIAKWGGGSEIAQVGCRALAVGGGVYVLNTGIQSIMGLPSDSDQRTGVQLSNGETIKTKYVVGSQWDLPSPTVPASSHKVARSMTIVSSRLEALFAVTAEGAPSPSGAVVVFPGSSLGEGNSPPVYLLVHSSDTVECPSGQCVVYGSVSTPGHRGQNLLETAVSKLLQSVGPTARPLWSLRYTQSGRDSDSSDIAQSVQPDSNNIICVPPPSLDLAYDDDMVDLVKAAWKVILGDEAKDDEFMSFEDREGAQDED